MPVGPRLNRHVEVAGVPLALSRDRWYGEQCRTPGLAADIVDQAVVASTAGPVDIIHVVCVQRHWFLMPLDRLGNKPQPMAVHGSRPATS